MVTLQVGIGYYGYASRCPGKVAMFILQVGVVYYVTLQVRVGYYGYASGWGRLLWFRFTLSW